MGGNLTNVVTCSDENITFIISGSCNLCGSCCTSEWVTTVFMMNSDSTNCKFQDMENKQCSFYIMSYEQLETVSAAALLYWENNCFEYPHYLSSQSATKLKESLDAKGWPYESCGYTLTVVSESG